MHGNIAQRLYKKKRETGKKIFELFQSWSSKLPMRAFSVQYDTKEENVCPQVCFKFSFQNFFSRFLITVKAAWTEI